MEGWQVTAALIVSGIAILLFVFGVVAGGRSVKIMAENRSLRIRNEMLLNERLKIAQLQQELEETSRMRQWMESLIVAESEETQREVQTANVGGMGFLSMLDRPFESRLVPELEEEADRQIRRMDFIPRGLPVNGAITAKFGEMGGKFLAPHSGVDIAAPKGTVVMATASGIVSSISKDKQLGLVLTIDHLNDYDTKYGHLSSVVVRPGDWVERNDRIGIVGETGHARGAHVHYEVLQNDEPIDPLGEEKLAEKEG